MESETPPDQKPPALSQQETDVPARESSTALGTGPPGVTNNSSSSKSGGKSKRSPQRRDTTLEENMQRSASPSASASTVKYTRTGRVSKATKGQPIHHCDDCGKTYSRAEHLRRHQQNHKPDAFPCDVVGCGRSFFREDLLARHKARHNDPLDPPTRRASIVSHTSGPSAEGLLPAAPQPPPTPSAQQSTSVRENDPTPYNLQNSARTSSSQPPTSRPQGKYLDINELPMSGRVPISINTNNQYPGNAIGGPCELINSFSPNPYETPPNEYLSGSCGPYYNQPSFAYSETTSMDSLYSVGGLQNVLVSPVSAGSSTAYAHDQGPSLQGEGFWHHSSSSSPPGVYGAEVHNTFGHQHYLQVAANGRIRMLSAAERDSTEFGDLIIPTTAPQDMHNRSPIANEQRYLASYWRRIHPLYPVIHRPSFDLEAASPLLRASMLALGAHELPSSQDQANARIIHERAMKILKRRDIENSHTLRICDLQAIVLTEIYALFKARRPPLYLSTTFVGAYDTLAQDAQSFAPDHLEPRHGSLPPPGVTEDMWWTGIPNLDSQCKQRLLLVCYVLDKQHAALFGRHVTARTTSMSGISLPFPASQSCWDAPIEEQADIRYRRQTSNIPLMAGIIEHPHDAFRSSLMMACLMDPQSDVQSWGFDVGSDLNLASTRLAIEQAPRTLLTYHVMMLCKHTPVRDLLAVAGDSWCISEKLATQTEYSEAQSSALTWAKGVAEPVYTTGSANHGLTVKRALCHARVILGIHREHPVAGLPFQEWAIYLAALVFWARAYAVPSEPCQQPQLSIPSPAELDEAIKRSITCETTAVSRDDARNVVLWVKARIERVDMAHNCGLTNSALDVLSKLPTSGNEERWYSA